MRILFVGDLNPHTRSFQRFRAMKGIAEAVEGVANEVLGTMAGVEPGPSLWYRVRYRLRIPQDRAGINAAMVQAADRFQPDVVWVEKTLALRRDALHAVRYVVPDAKLISFSEDDMFASHNQSVYYRQCLPLYDTVFTTKSYNANPEELPAMGARSVVFFDKTYDLVAHRPLPVTQEDRELFGADVGFVGTFEEARANSMLALANAGIPVRIWGNGWARWVGRHLNLRVENQPVFGDDFLKALCATRINLCFLRKINRDLQTDRTMEIPACGAFMLAERTPEHLRLFEEGREAAYFNVDDTEELVRQARYYLDHEEERVAIAESGRRRCLKGGYSHHDMLTGALVLLQNHQPSRQLA